jgi:hypothetical protein
VMGLMTAAPLTELLDSGDSAVPPCAY